MSEKKQWVKPQLIVLGRGTPEERVLAHCKAQTTTIYGPAATQSSCQNVKGNCGACQDMGGRGS